MIEAELEKRVMVLYFLATLYQQSTIKLVPFSEARF